MLPDCQDKKFESVHNKCDNALTEILTKIRDYSVSDKHDGKIFHLKSKIFRCKRNELQYLLLNNIDKVCFDLQDIKACCSLSSKYVNAGVYNCDYTLYTSNYSLYRMTHKCCRFSQAYMKMCQNLSLEDSDFCDKHINVLCKCGKQATHECSFAGQFVCGRPLCNDCKCKH